MPARKVDRPKTNLTVRIDPLAKAWLEKTAAQEGMSVGDFLRYLMKMGMKQYTSGNKPGDYSAQQADEVARRLEDPPKKLKITRSFTTPSGLGGHA